MDRFVRLITAWQNMLTKTACGSIALLLSACTQTAYTPLPIETNTTHDAAKNTVVYFDDTGLTLPQDQENKIDQSLLDPSSKIVVLTVAPIEKDGAALKRMNQAFKRGNFYREKLKKKKPNLQVEVKYDPKALVGSMHIGFLEIEHAG